MLSAPPDQGWIAETTMTDRSSIQVHALVDVIARSLRLVLTEGNTFDIRGADLLVADAVRMKRMIADCGFHANKLCATRKAQGTIPVVKEHRNQNRPIQYHASRDSYCWRVEVTFCRLEQWPHRTLALPEPQPPEQAGAKRPLGCPHIAAIPFLPCTRLDPSLAATMTKQVRSPLTLDESQTALRNRRIH